MLSLGSPHAALPYALIEIEKRHVFLGFLSITSPEIALA